MLLKWIGVFWTMEIGFSLGSNLGDKLSFLKIARNKLLEKKDGVLLEQSSVYLTKPVNVPEMYLKHIFLNAVIIIETDISAEYWLNHLSNIEREMGRIRGEQINQPRFIDIDIVYYSNQIIDTPNLKIPHPRCFERGFVLAPLAEVRPNLILPGQAKKVYKLWESLQDKEGLKKTLDSW